MNADEQLEKTLELDSTWALGHQWLADNYIFRGELEDAIAHLERADELSNVAFGVGQLGMAYALAGRTDDARATLDRLHRFEAEGHHVPHVEWVSIYAGLGDLDASFEWLEKAYVDRASDLALYRFRPGARILEKDRRFADLFRRMGLEE